MEILFEDDDLLAVNKPAGLPSQQTLDPKRPHVLSELCQQLGLDPKNPGLFLHHRLDRDTTGVFLLSKTTRANAPLSQLFREHHFRKIYLCWCRQTPNFQPLPRLPNFHTVENHLAVERKSSRQKQKVIAVRAGGRWAETRLSSVRTVGSRTLVQAEPLTGRTHQIRVHCAGLGSPILGDLLYDSQADPSLPLQLHARELHFLHPIGNFPITIQAPLPNSFLR